MNLKYMTVDFSVRPVHMLAEIGMVLKTAKKALRDNGYTENEAVRMLDLVNELQKREDKEEIVDELERILNE